MIENFITSLAQSYLIPKAFAMVTVVSTISPADLDVSPYFFVKYTFIYREIH